MMIMMMMMMMALVVRKMMRRHVGSRIAVEDTGAIVGKHDDTEQ